MAEEQNDTPSSEEPKQPEESQPAEEPKLPEAADDSGKPHEPTIPSSHLTYYIVAAIILAVIVSLAVPSAATAEFTEGFIAVMNLGGKVFLRLLMMIVVPLVVASVMSGILGMGDIRKLGRPGGYTVLYYMCTTFLAVSVGVLMVNLVQPGTHVTAEQLDKAKQEAKEHIEEGKSVSKEAQERATPAQIMEDLVLLLFTDNLIMSAARGDLLPLIVFSICFAGMLTTMGPRVQIITDFVLATNDALLDFVLLLMRLAPLGIFCLVAGRFTEAQYQGEFLDLLEQVGYYVLTVLVGLGIHAFITLPLIYWFFTRKNPYVFFRKMSDALLTAFSTASSSGTLPLTMDVAEKRAGISRRSVEFVLPLGATINMDGTALYEAAAAIFIAQAAATAGVIPPLTWAAQLTIFVTATLAAIGAAGIPEAGLVTLLIVLNAVGLPVEYLPLILSIDWLLDRFRTAVNVFGDSVGAAVVEKSFEAVK